VTFAAAATPVRTALAPLRLLRMARLTFTAADATPPDLRESCELLYFADMSARYGLPFRADALAGDRLVGYSEMAEKLLDALAPLDEPIDIVVVGHAVPDADIGRFVGCTLSAAAPGEALPFAISDQGNATSFTALRLAGEYARAGDVRHVLVVLLDQTTLPYDIDLSELAQPLHDSGIALLFGPAGPGNGLAVRQLADVDSDQVAELLAETVAELVGDRAPSALVVGQTLAGATTLPATVAEAGRPAGALWWALDESAGPRVVLADYDPALRYLCVATVDR
jgi:hypothetical protein